MIDDDSIHALFHRLMELAAAESKNTADMDTDEDNDADYYRKEVGAEPEKGKLWLKLP